MNKRLFPAAIAAAVLCAMLAVIKLNNPESVFGSQGQAASQQEQAAEQQGQAATQQEQGASQQEQAAGQQEQADPAGEAVGQPGTAEENAEGGGQPGLSEESAENGEQPGQTGQAGQAEHYKPLSVTETGEYTEKVLRVIGTGSEDRSEAVRFYKESPHVPYMGIRAYFDLMLGGGLKVQAAGDGTYTLTNAAGAQAVVDIGRGTVSAQDMPAFENYFDEAREGKASSFKDSEAPYLKLREVVYEGSPEPVQFELGKLGIALHADEDEVWFPVSILSSWLTDIAQNRVACNGDCLYVLCSDTAYELDDGYYSTEYFDKILTGSERAEDLAAYSYAELGFIFRYMYGYPGRTELDSEILRGEGLDEALAAWGEEGQALRGELASRDFKDFWFAMFKLSDGPMEDGHNSTSLSIGVVDADQTDKYKDFRSYTWSKFDNLEISEFVGKLSAASGGIYSVRPEELSTNKYYKCGDTAVILLNGFTVDATGWNSYYNGGGELPEDTMGVAAKGLKKASEDAEIRNVVFDLSTNPGGYSDAAMGVLSLMTGRDYLNGYNEQSKQAFRVYFDVDRNLDGEINEEDDKVNYDFNYAVTEGRSERGIRDFYFRMQVQAGGRERIGFRAGRNAGCSAGSRGE